MTLVGSRDQANSECSQHLADRTELELEAEQLLRQTTCRFSEERKQSPSDRNPLKLRSQSEALCCSELRGGVCWVGSAWCPWVIITPERVEGSTVEHCFDGLNWIILQYLMGPMGHIPRCLVCWGEAWLGPWLLTSCSWSSFYTFLFLPFPVFKMKAPPC